MTDETTDGPVIPLSDIDPKTATAVEVLAALYDTLRSSVADTEEILRVSAEWSQGRSDFEQRAVAREVAHLPEQLRQQRDWLGQIEALGPNPTEADAGALIVRYSASPMPE